MLLSGGGGGGGSGNTAPVVSGIVIANTKTAPASITFTLTDLDSDPVDVDIVFTDGGGAEVQALLSGDTNLNDLASSASGVVHTRLWAFATQVSSGSSFAEGFSVTVRALDGFSSSTALNVALGNDAPAVTIVGAPTTEASGIVPISITVSDSSNDLVSLAVDYEDAANPSGWTPATGLGSAPVVVGSPLGTDVVFFWNAPLDEPAQDMLIRLRFVPNDGVVDGAPAMTDPFGIDNNDEPIAILNGSAFLANPDKRRGIPIAVRVADAEGNPVRVVFQYRREQDPFPLLPTSPGALATILGDPAQCVDYQIATELPQAFEGRVGLSAAPDRARLRELDGDASPLIARRVVGRELEILRGSAIPAPIASSWPSNPLSGPVDVAPRGNGTEVLVLQSAFPGTWDLIAVDVATGNVSEAIVSAASGTPSALSLSPDESVAHVAASGGGGTWTVHRVDLKTLTVDVVATADGTTELGPVRDLIGLGGDVCLLTVGSSLIRVDGSIVPAGQATLFDDLAEPYGLAADPRGPHRVYVAERGFGAAGRVLAVELDTLTRQPVHTSGLLLPRPTTLWFDRGGVRLLVVTDEDDLDGTRELRATDLGGEEQGAVFELVAVIPGSVGGGAAGHDGLAVLALTSSNELAVGGGIEQHRTITDFDPTRLEVTVDAAFAPPLRPTCGWRIRDSMDPVLFGAGQTEVDEIFVWDSADVPSGGGVILQAVPYDTEIGTATDSGVPRPILGGLDVPPLTLLNASDATAPRVVHAADLDQDGDHDLIAAGDFAAGVSDLGLFFQSAPRTFPVTPNLFLGVSLPLLASNTPVAIDAADVDADGDTDVLTANQLSANFTIWRQALPGAFLTAPSIFLNAPGASARPSSARAADLDGDGAIDVVGTVRGSNVVAIYEGVAGFVLPTAPTLVIGGPAVTAGPEQVVVGDLDLDGALDLAIVNESGGNVAVFLQTAAGSFGSSPNFTIGGGILSAPRGLVLGDLDGDGDEDLACANSGAGSIAVFRQNAPGVFPAVPDFTVGSGATTAAPTRIGVADFDGDGRLELLTTNSSGQNATIFYQHKPGVFGDTPLVIGGTLATPGMSWATADDIDGDGDTDLVSANTGAHNLTLFFQGSAAHYPVAPSLLLGDSQVSPGPTDLAAGDLDADGHIDLAVANETGDGLTAFLQFAPALFAGQALLVGPPGFTVAAGGIEIGDLNADGLPDLLGGTTTSALGFLQSGVSPGTYGPLPDVALGGPGVLESPHAALIEDVDGDGDNDVALGNASGNQVSLFLQGAPGAYAAVPNFEIGVTSGSTNGPADVGGADLDGDGDIDLASANAGAATLTVWFQLPGAVFSPAPNRTLTTGASPSSFAIADIDRDGDLDLAVASVGGDSVGIYYQTLPGVFPTAADVLLTNAPALDGPNAVRVFDFDLDGDRDLVTANAAGKGTIFRQSSPGVFRPDAGYGLTGATNGASGLSALDLDGDGDPDVAASVLTSNAVAAFFSSHP